MCLTYHRTRQRSDKRRGKLKRYLPVKGRFVRRVIEDLQELASTKMEHELRVDAESLAQLETRRVCAGTASQRKVNDVTL